MIPVGDREFDSAQPAYAFIDLDNMRAGFKRMLRAHDIGDEAEKVFDFGKIFERSYFDKRFLYSAIEIGENAPGWINSLRRRPTYILRSGVLTNKSGKRKQEGVDVLLALDAISHAHKRNMKSCAVFSADGDLLPLVESLSSEGIICIVSSFDNPEKSDVCSRLRDAADDYCRIGSWILHQCFSDEHKCVSRGAGTLNDQNRGEYPEIHPSGSICYRIGTSDQYQAYKLDQDGRSFQYFQFESELAARVFSKLLRRL